MGLKLQDYTTFMRELIGSMHQSEFIRFDKLQQFFRGVIVQRIKVLIADIIINQKISALEITPKLEEISDITRSRIKETFEGYGLDVVNFFIQSINFPDEDFDAINSILHKRAEFDLIGDARYATARTFNVYETAAGNSSGVAGAFVAGGVGLGAGVVLGGQIPQAMANTAPGGTICPYCSSDIPGGIRFCSSCGKNLEPPKCSSCGITLAHGAKFCGGCGIEVIK
jgi:membrane protease subunit (stomatin/prohibitin family)